MPSLQGKYFQFSHSVVSDSLLPHGLEYTRLPCSSPTAGAYSNSSPLSQWCHPTILSSIAPFSSCTKSFQVSRSSNELALHIIWPRYWSFSISSSNEYYRLISFRINLFDHLAVQGTVKSLLQLHSSKSSIFRILSSLWSSSQNHTWLMEKPLCSFVGKVMSLLF